MRTKNQSNCSVRLKTHRQHHGSRGGVIAQQKLSATRIQHRQRGALARVQRQFVRQFQQSGGQRRRFGNNFEIGQFRQQHCRAMFQRLIQHRLRDEQFLEIVQQV